MPIGLLFWMLMILWLIFGGVWWRNGAGWAYTAGRCRQSLSLKVR